MNTIIKAFTIEFIKNINDCFNKFNCIYFNNLFRKTIYNFSVKHGLSLRCVMFNILNNYNILKINNVKFDKQKTNYYFMMKMYDKKYKKEIIVKCVKDKDETPFTFNVLYDLIYSEFFKNKYNIVCVPIVPCEYRNIPYYKWKRFYYNR